MKSQIKDLTGQVFDRLTVIECVGTDKFHRSLWKCKCSCGKDCVAAGTVLRAGSKRSCGCIGKELFKKNRVKTRSYLIGERFGRLLVEREDRVEASQVFWVCQCDCGGRISVATHALKRGNTRSCGCLRSETLRTRKGNPTHGLSRDGNGKKSRLYNIWTGMKTRCFNQSAREYPGYGGRGISLCSEWMDFGNFSSWAKSNGYDESLTIERIDNDGNYEASNCTWIPRTSQSRNRRDTVLISFRGITMTLAEWSRKTGINNGTLHRRIRKQGWSIERALTTK